MAGELDRGAWLGDAPGMGRQVQEALAAPTVTNRSSELRAELDMLDAMIGRLSDAVSTLELRLVFVMGQQPEAEQPVGVAQPDRNSPVGNEVWSLRIRVARQAELVEQVLDRLEV